MTIEEMKTRKQELGLTTKEIADLSGIPLSTLQRLFSGVIERLGRADREAIGKALYEEGARRKLRDHKNHENHNDHVNHNDHENYKDAPYSYEYPKIHSTLKEPDFAYGAADGGDKLYTAKDYYALPDDQRVELIDGRFYEMYSPTKKHQLILGELYVKFRECVRYHNMPCRVFLAPCDVRLDRDDLTIVQPDLFIYCHKSDISEIVYDGAPDLVVEILSPSTRSKDMVLKFYKYQKAGVGEYWIVDPDSRTVTVHYFDGDPYQPKMYDFFSEIPVSLSKGICRIDFSEIGREFDHWPD